MWIPGGVPLKRSTIQLSGVMIPFFFSYALPCFAVTTSLVLFYHWFDKRRTARFSSEFLKAFTTGPSGSK